MRCKNWSKKQLPSLEKEADPARAATAKAVSQSLDKQSCETCLGHARSAPSIPLQMRAV